MGRNLKPKPRARTSCTENRVVTTGRACLRLLEGQQEAASALRPPAPRELPGPRCPEDSSRERALGWPPLRLVSNHKEGCLPTALRNLPVLHLRLTDTPAPPPTAPITCPSDPSFQVLPCESSRIYSNSAFLRGPPGPRPQSTAWAPQHHCSQPPPLAPTSITCWKVGNEWFSFMPSSIPGVTCLLCWRERGDCCGEVKNTGEAARRPRFARVSGPVGWRTSGNSPDFPGLPLPQLRSREGLTWSSFGVSGFDVLWPPNSLLHQSLPPTPPPAQYCTPM